MKLGKANYIFARAWSWLSRIITVANFGMLSFLVLRENTVFLFVVPFLLLLWVVVAIVDIKKIMPEELEYLRQKDPEWLKFVDSTNRQFKELKTVLEEKK